MDCSTAVFPVLHISQSLLKLMSIETVIPSSHLVLCHPLLLLPSIFFSIRVFSSELALRIRWPKYWCFSFSISPSNEYSGLISFGIDWFDLLAVLGTVKSLFHYHSLEVSILWHSIFFMVQLSHLYMTTGKTIASTVRTFVGKVMSLLFNMLSRFVIFVIIVRFKKGTFSTLKCTFMRQIINKQISFFKKKGNLNGRYIGLKSINISTMHLKFPWKSIWKRKKGSEP